MLNNHSLKKLIVILSIPIVGLISLVAISNKQVFYYAEWKDSREVVFDSAKFGENKLNDFYSKIVNIDGVARIYRQENKVIFQQVSREEVIQTINENLGSEDSTLYSISDLRNVSQIRYVDNIILASIFLAFSIVGYHFVISFRKKEDQSMISIGNFYIPFILSSTIAVVTYFFLISLVSRFYLITSIDLMFAPLALITSGVFMLANSKSTSQESLKSFTSILQSYKRIYSESEIYNFFRVALIILVFITIGMGGNFLISAILLVIAIGLQLYIPRWFVLSAETDYKALFLSLKNSIRRQENLHRNERGEVMDQSKKSKVIGQRSRDKGQKTKSSNKKYRKY